jgi:hypothetical protein
MLNRTLRKEALRELKDAQAAHDEALARVTANAEELFRLRQEGSTRVIDQVESYINRLANSPKTFDRSFALYKAEFATFTTLVHALEHSAARVDVTTGSSAMAGVVAGVGVVTLAPTAAIGIATTFGVASTGTAISTLSGAAATNAALAWLGGGALATGGGGIAGGSALLALANPVGVGIGAALLAGSALLARQRNRKIVTDANDQRKGLLAQTAQLTTALHETARLIDLTRQHVAGVDDLLERLRRSAPANYRDFDVEQKEWLGALINHIQCLSALLNKKVDA